MSQHDLSIANQTFPATRSDINDALQALGSLQSGATAPSTTYANQLWLDTTASILKLRNSDNDAWIELFEVDQVGDKITLTAKVVSGESGSQSAPVFSFDGDTDTGIYRSAANEISVTTGGSQRLIIESDGDVVLVNGTPALKLKDVDSTGSSQVGQLQFVDSADSINAQMGYLSGANTDLTIKNGVASSKVKTNIAGTDRLEVNSTGAVVTGNLDVSGTIDGTLSSAALPYASQSTKGAARIYTSGGDLYIYTTD